MHDPSEGGLAGPWISPYLSKSEATVASGPAITGVAQRNNGLLGTIMSDRRVKEDVASGAPDVEDFLGLVRRRRRVAQSN